VSGAPEKPFCVVDAGGAGWGRYDTIEEALERADMLGRNGDEYTVARAITSSRLKGKP
jgi:hypothetical protein